MVVEGWEVTIAGPAMHGPKGSARAALKGRGRHALTHGKLPLADRSFSKPPDLSKREVHANV
jgi:hypothetical protein